MKFSQAIKMAVSSIISNKMRSFLTMLGIIIGIFSVIILISIGQGTKNQVAAQIESLGTNLITVNITGNRNKTVTNQELADLKTKPGIKEIAPVISGSTNAKAGDKSYSTSIQATVPSYEEIKDVHAQSGRFINQNDVDNRYRVAVLGVDVVDNLFSNRNVVGKKISLNGVDFTVIGVLASKGTSAAGSNDDVIIMPLSTAQRLLKNKNIRTFNIEATSPDTVNTAVVNLNLFMMRKFNNDTTSFRVLNQSDLLATQNQTNDNLTMMLGGIAGISLLVGGIGIMNIMLVSVIERTQEIGLRKSIGAKRRDILLQFMIEALLISGIGGLMGVLFGFIGTKIIGPMMKMSLSLSPMVVVIAFGFSATVGLIFGLYPANKASKLKPIDALRYE